MWGETVVGMTKTVTWYCQASGWKAIKLEGVSVVYGHSRVSVDKRNQTGRRYLDIGESREKNGKIVIPKSVLDVEFIIEPGDLILIGEGPKKLKTPSELKQKGWNFLRVQSVEDHRRDEILPHIVVTGC